MGELNLKNNRITGLAKPKSGQDAVRLKDLLEHIQNPYAHGYRPSKSSMYSYYYDTKDWTSGVQTLIPLTITCKVNIEVLIKKGFNNSSTIKFKDNDETLLELGANDIAFDNSQFKFVGPKVYETLDNIKIELSDTNPTAGRFYFTIEVIYL